MKKLFRPLLILLAYANLFYTIYTVIVDYNSSTELLYDNSNLLYIRDFERKILHLTDCVLVEELEDFGCIFTGDGYYNALSRWYEHCDFVSIKFI